MLDPQQRTRIADILRHGRDRILSEWIAAQSAAGVLRSDLMTLAEIRRQSQQLLGVLSTVLDQAAGGVLPADLAAPEWQDLRQILEELTTYRVQRGFTPSETATFIMSLKAPLFARYREVLADDPAALVDGVLAASTLLDRLGLYTNEVFQRGREDIIQRQQEEMLELSTPVIRLWDRIVALPLIGTLDSNRAQIVTESLLEAVVRTEAEIVIIDITGVPTVDTLVAQHLLKTASAARLMGAECILCGIRPQIAQTIVQLGVELSHITTKADLQSALIHALQQTGIDLSRGVAAA